MPPYRIECLDEAKVDVRCLDRPTAMRIFDGILCYRPNIFLTAEETFGQLQDSFSLGSRSYIVD